MGLAGWKRNDSQGIRNRQDRQRACELSYERRVMPLRYCAMRGWQGPHAVIFIGGFIQLSAEILAERGGAHKTLMRRSNRNKNVRRGSGEPYRHSDLRIAPCANMSCRSLHCRSELGIARHTAALWSIVTVVPAMKTTVMRSRT